MPKGLTLVLCCPLCKKAYEENPGKFAGGGKPGTPFARSSVDSAWDLPGERIRPSHFLTACSSSPPPALSHPGHLAWLREGEVRSTSGFKQPSTPWNVKLEHVSEVSPPTQGDITPYPHVQRRRIVVGQSCSYAAFPTARLPQKLESVPTPIQKLPTSSPNLHPTN